MGDRDERLMVCVGPGPGSARLVRAAHQLSVGLRCPWVAAHVSVPAAPRSGDHVRVEGHLALAESLGGEVARLSGRREVEAIVEFACRRRVTRILIGKPAHPRWRDLFRGSLVDELARASGDIDVHVLTGSGEEPASPDAGQAGAPRVSRRSVAAGAREVVFAIALVLGVTGLAKGAAPVFSDADILMGYLLVVLVAAFRWTRSAALGAAAVSVVTYNFFFVAPLYTLAVEDARNLLTFAVLFGVGVAASTLAGRLRSQEGDALAREQRTAALLSLTRALAVAVDEPGIASAIVTEAATRIAQGAYLVPCEPGSLVILAHAGMPAGEREVRAVAAEATVRGGRADRGALRALLVQAGALRFAVLVLVEPRIEVADVLDAYPRQAALALARARLATEAEAASLRVQTEQVKNALLSTVSHDLRTPLASITGAATALLDEDVVLSRVDARELLVGVRNEAERLERLVANLLEMTRLTSGSIVLRRAWIPVDELVGTAFRRVEDLLLAHPTRTALAPDLPLVDVDPVLAEILLVNLMENAARHTPAGTPITVLARPAVGGVEIEVRDRGPGLPAGDPERLFEPFVRGEGAVSRGSGLGLAICRGIARAHGGDVRAEPGPEGGASFVVSFPTTTEPPTVLLDAVGET